VSFFGGEAFGVRQFAAAFEMRLLKKRQQAAALQSAFGTGFKKT